jgi:hypothetical protein
MSEDLSETKETMKLVGDVIKMILPEGYGFVFMIFETNVEGRMNYMSNCQRPDVIKMMKEFIEKTETAWAVDKFDGTFGVGGKSNG